MPVFRNNRLRSSTRSIALMVALLATVPVFAAGADSAPPAASATPTPLSQATTDDVEFSLVSFHVLVDSTVEIEIHAENHGAFPVRIVEALIELAVHTPDGATAVRRLATSAPALPCAIATDTSLTMVFTFDIEPGDELIAVSIGLEEAERTGAMVIFPLVPGAGASAIGGSGIAGASGTPAASSSPTPETSPPGASPEAETCST